MNSILTEYDEERVLADLKKDSYEDGKEDGIREGIREGIRVLVESLKDLHVLKDNVVETVAKKFGLSVEKATADVDKYWE